MALGDSPLLLPRRPSRRLVPRRHARRPVRARRSTGRCRGLGATSPSLRYLACPILLVADLGRPERFPNMLRIVKARSPMSMGSWALTGFGFFAGLGVLRQMIEDGVIEPRLSAGSTGRVAAPLGLGRTRKPVRLLCRQLHRRASQLHERAGLGQEQPVPGAAVSHVGAIYGAGRDLACSRPTGRRPARRPPVARSSRDDCLPRRAGPDRGDHRQPRPVSQTACSARPWAAHAARRCWAWSPHAAHPATVVGRLTGGEEASS